MGRDGGVCFTECKADSECNSFYLTKIVAAFGRAWSYTCHYLREPLSSLYDPQGREWIANDKACEPTSAIYSTWVPASATPTPSAPSSTSAKASATTTPSATPSSVCNARGEPKSDSSQCKQESNVDMATCISRCRADNNCKSTAFNSVTAVSGKSAYTCNYYTQSVKFVDNISGGIWFLNDKAC